MKKVRLIGNVVATIPLIITLVLMLVTNGDAQMAPGSVRIRDTANGSITIGQKTMANSLPVVISSDQATITTTQGAFTTITTGQQAVTASAVVLATTTASRVCLKILAAGTQIVYFGPSGVTTSNGQELSPGDAWCGPISNTNKIFVIAGATGSTVAWDVLN